MAARSNGTGKDRSDLWVQVPRFNADNVGELEDYMADKQTPSWDKLVLNFLAEGLSVSLRESDDSYCCTLTDTERREAEQPCLVSGWAGTPQEAVVVAAFKHYVWLKQDWGSDAFPVERLKYR